MKKKIFTLLALFASVLSAYADNKLSVDKVYVKAGGTTSFSINLENTDELCGFTMFMTLPSGITLSGTQKCGEIGEDGCAINKTDRTQGELVDPTGSNPYGLGYISTKALPGNRGSIIQVNIQADGSLGAGTVLKGKIDKINFGSTSIGEVKLDDIEFDIEISDKVVLDENSAAAPAAQNGVNVLVKRTIKAGQWNTICLPFDLPDAKVKEIFGADVKLCDFDGYTVDGNSFTVKFKDVSNEGIYSGWPCLIKTSVDITEFEVNGVDVSPVLINVESKETRKSGKTEVEVVVAKMTGTMNAGTILSNNELFISGGKFYFSSGTTPIKGFRGYFWLEKFDGASAAPEINFEVGGETTKIDGLNVIFDDGQYYNLKGQKVDNPTEKGVYIKNGKKVVIK